MNGSGIALCVSMPPLVDDPGQRRRRKDGKQTGLLRYVVIRQLPDKSLILPVGTSQPELASKPILGHFALFLVCPLTISGPGPAPSSGPHVRRCLALELIVRLFPVLLLSVAALLRTTAGGT